MRSRSGWSATEASEAALEDAARRRTTPPARASLAAAGGVVLRREASPGTKAKADRRLGRLWEGYLGAREQLNVLAEEGRARTGSERRARRLCGRLVAAYLPLVRYVVGRSSCNGSYHANENRVAWDMVGLLEAVEGCDPARGAKFETYAVSKIRYGFLEGLRKEEPCRRLKSFARENDRAATELTQGLGRRPTEAEMTQKLGTSIKRYRNLLEQYSRQRVASPGNRTEKEYGPDVVADVVADRDAFDPHTQAERTELREGLVEALAALEEKERVVVTLYFYEGLKLKEIGMVLGLSEGRISQLLSGALCKLRGSLSGGASLSLAS